MQTPEIITLPTLYQRETDVADLGTDKIPDKIPELFYIPDITSVQEFRWHSRINLAYYALFSNWLTDVTGHVRKFNCQTSVQEE